MISIVDAQREVLLDASGTNVWSGQTIQSLNSQAVTWSLAKELYSASGPYVIVPIGLAIGLVPPFIQWLISKVRLAFRVDGRRRSDSLLVALAHDQRHQG